MKVISKITYGKLLNLHKSGWLSFIESVPVYPGQIEFEFVNELENNFDILNDWFTNFFIELSNGGMANSYMTSCSFEFLLSEKEELICDVHAEINSESDLFVCFNEHDENYEGVEEWSERISLTSFFLNSQT